MLKDHFDNNTDLDFYERIGERVYQFNLLDELHFDSETVNEQIIENTKKTALIQEMYDRKTNELAKVNLDYELWRARTWAAIKSKQKDVSGKTYSDDRVTILVEGHKDYQLNQEKLIKIKKELSRLKNALNRFTERKDLLQTFASNLRKIS